MFTFGKNVNSHAKCTSGILSVCIEGNINIVQATKERHRQACNYATIENQDNSKYMYDHWAHTEVRNKNNYQDANALKKGKKVVPMQRT